MLLTCALLLNPSALTDMRSIYALHEQQLYMSRYTAQTASIPVVNGFYTHPEQHILL